MLEGNELARSNGLREKAETAISCRDLHLPERRKRYTSSREEEDVDAHLCPCGKTIGKDSHSRRV